MTDKTMVSQSLIDRIANWDKIIVRVNSEEEARELLHLCEKFAPGCLRTWTPERTGWKGTRSGGTCYRLGDDKVSIGSYSTYLEGLCGIYRDYDLVEYSGVIDISEEERFEVDTDALLSML